MRSFLDHPSRDVVQSADPGPVHRLSPDQIETLSAVLHDLLDEHRQSLADNEDLFRTLTDDSSVDADERRTARVGAEQEFTAIQATNRALVALNDGLYGICARCDQPIPYERLGLLPTTQTCVGCPELASTT